MKPNIETKEEQRPRYLAEEFLIEHRKRRQSLKDIEIRENTPFFNNSPKFS